MLEPAFTSEQVPDYHEGMLIVKVRSIPPSAASMLAPMGAASASFSSPEVTEALSGSPGLSALSVFERAGLIKQAIPLSRSVEPSISPGPVGAMSTLAASVDAPASEDRHAGVSLIQVENNDQVAELQTALGNDPNVEFVSRVPVRYLLTADSPGMGVEAVPPPASTMWNLRRIEWEAARALPNFREADGVQVAVLDTGVDPNHPDLNQRVDSYIFDHPDIPSVSSDQDIIGHGTHVSGTITADSNNIFGINGICRCRLRVWKIFDDKPDCVPGTLFTRPRLMYFVDPVMYQRALADCLDEGVDVINLSIGGRGQPDANERQLFNELLNSGTTVVAAMGNEREQGSPISFPAALPGVIAVGATSRDDTVARFSNRGNHISLCAPGVAIWSTLPTYPGQSEFSAISGPSGTCIQGKPRRRETDYDAWDGTSMATPHVTAAVALLLANKGRTNPADVRNHLMAAADKVPGMRGASSNSDYGAGRLNLANLLNA